MGNLVKKQRDDGLLVYVVDEIDEGSDLVRQIGPVEGTLELNCRGVSRINSAGVRNWTTYFRQLDRNKVKVKFLECSPALIQEAGLVPNFFCRWEVESVFVPFLCNKCKEDVRKLFNVSDLKGMNLDSMVIPCPTCGGEAEFDDIPDQYFRFMRS